MIDHLIMYILPGFFAIGFCATITVCIRICRRRQTMQRMQTIPPTQSPHINFEPSVISNYSPSYPNSSISTVPTVPVPSAPPASSDSIVFPYNASAPPEPELPSIQFIYSPTNLVSYPMSYPVTYPSTFPTYHIPISQVTAENRIYWNTGQSTV